MLVAADAIPPDRSRRYAAGRTTAARITSTTQGQRIIVALSEGLNREKDIAIQVGSAHGDWGVSSAEKHTRNDELVAK